MVLYRSLAVLVCAIASMACATAAIAGDTWRVVQAVGNVQVGGEGVMPVALSNNRVLPGGAWVQTADGGRALLSNGSETIAIAPNSRVLLPSEKVGDNTQVLQSVGSVLYQISKQLKPHFQVDTPYLAAVVKGTTFTVTVKKGAATVEVTEGLVEVATPDRLDSEFVGAGFMATVHDNQKTVAVERSIVSLDPAKQEQAKPIVINQPIGEVTIDVKKESGGLIGASSTANETIALNTKTPNGNANGNDGKNDSTGVSLTASDEGNNGNANGNADNGAGNGNGNSGGSTVLAPPDLGGGNNGNAFGADNGIGGNNGNGNGNGGGDGSNAGGNGNGNGNGRGS